MSSHAPGPDYRLPQPGAEQCIVPPEPCATYTSLPRASNNNSIWRLHSPTRSMIQLCVFRPHGQGRVPNCACRRAPAGARGLEQLPTIRNRLTGFSRLLARRGSRRGLADHKRTATQSSGREKPAFGGPNPPIRGVASLAQPTRLRGAPRLAEWADLTPSNGPVWSEVALASGDRRRDLGGKVPLFLFHAFAQGKARKSGNFDLASNFGRRRL